MCYTAAVAIATPAQSTTDWDRRDEPPLPVVGAVTVSAMRLSNSCEEEGKRSVESSCVSDGASESVYVYHHSFVCMFEREREIERDKDRTTQR